MASYISATSRGAGGYYDNAGYDEEDAYGDEYAEGALETVAEEGNDSDIEAEENERYNRRPRAADGPVERSTESGFLARQPCRAALVAPTSHQVGYNTHEKPEHHLQLDFVYGYRAHDARHNLVYNIDGLITYPAVRLSRTQPVVCTVPYRTRALTYSERKQSL